MNVHPLYLSRSIYQLAFLLTKLELRSSGELVPLKFIICRCCWVVNYCLIIIGARIMRAQQRTTSKLAKQLG